MVRLSVNINKIALIRNSRGSNKPDLATIAKDCEKFGAQGITVHPRPDQRHVRYDDIALLKAVVKTEFNIEGNPTRDFIDLVCTNKPHQVTLVPDEPGALTSNAGWDTVKHASMLTDIISEFKSYGIRVSLFADPDPRMIEGAKKIGADRVELYTGPYAGHFAIDHKVAVAAYAEAGKEAAICKIGLNAGHDLDLKNLRYFKDELPNLLEVSIGHALVCDALYYGLKNTIQMYLGELD
jgi:pyridoxine 5-phosphate synthase